MEKFIGFLWEYVYTVLFSWIGLLLLITGAWDLYERSFDKKPVITARVRIVVIVLVFFVAQLIAYRELRDKFDTAVTDHSALKSKLSEAGSRIKSLEDKLKELPKVVYRDKPAMDRQESIARSPQLQIVGSRIRPEGSTKIISLEVKNAGSERADGKVEFSTLIGGIKKTVPLTVAIAPGVSRHLNSSVDDKDFDSVASGRFTLEFIVEIDYKGSTSKLYGYSYRSVYDHRAGQFNIVEEKWR